MATTGHQRDTAPQRPPDPAGPAKPTAPNEPVSSGHLARRLLVLVVLLGLVAVAVVSLPGLGTLRHRFAHADWRLLVVIGLFKLGSCLSNIVAFRDVFCARLGWRFSYQLGMAEQATDRLLPTGGAGGLALGAWALHQEGMASETIARRSIAFFVLTSIPNFAVTAVLGPVLLIGVFHGKVPTAPTIVFTALAWTVTVIVALLPRLLHRFGAREHEGRLTSKLRVAAVSLESGIADVGTIIRERRWQAILGAFGYLAFDIAALLVAFAAFGSHLPLAPLIFAYVVGQLGGLIPIPGGVGGTDGGLIGALVLYGAPLSTATAATLAYRAFQLGVPAVLGTISFFGLRHTLARAHDAPAAVSASTAPAPDSPGRGDHHGAKPPTHSS